MRISFLALVLLLGCQKKDGGTASIATPTCETVADYIPTLIAADPDAPEPLKERFASWAPEDKAEAVEECKSNGPSEADLKCMLNAKTFEAFRVCDRRARGHAE